MITLALFFALTFPVSQAAAANPKYGPDATRLHDAREHIRESAAPDFWALVPYYVPQQDGRSCSVASVAMLVNAARADQKLTASDELVTQPGILKKVNSKIWKQGVGSTGRGVTLDQLGALVGESLKAYGFAGAKVEVVHVDAESPEAKAKLQHALAENEKSAGDFILVNFLQSVYTGDPEGAVGHIAPLAAYDAKRGRALIFDPDRQYYEPYWVSVDVLVKGMATADQVAGKNRGYVHVRLNR